MRCLVLYLALLAYSFLEVVAQDFSLNSSWTNPNAADSRSDREVLANAAAQALVQRIGSSGSVGVVTNGQALASMYSSLALQDILSGNKTWMKDVTAGLGAWASANDIFTNGSAGSLRTTSNAAQWGVAFSYAYEAYGNASFLSLAQDAFDQIYPYFITTEGASSYHPSGNRTWIYNSTKGQCITSAAGGIWWLPDVLDIDEVHADTVGPFAVLAGHLYQAIPNNDTYKTAGMLSTSFLGWSAWFDTGALYVRNQIAIWSCEYYGDTSPGAQGWYIQALAIWANLTSDPTFTSQLRKLISANTRNALWTQPDGILIDAPAGSSNESDNHWDDKAILIRGLSETSRRFTIWTDVSAFIEGFINVQYNQFIGSARNPSINAYSTTIFGPAPQDFDSQGNILALDVLNAAFDTLPKPNDTSGSTPSPSSPSHNTSASKASAPVGAITGGVVGGVAGIVALLGVLFCRLHRRRQSSITEYTSGANATASPILESALIEPYIATAPTTMWVKGGELAPPSLEYQGAPSSNREVVTTTGSAAEGPVSRAQDEEVVTVSVLRRFLSNFAQEHPPQSAPPEYST